jgi:hypothetical protein
MRSCGSTDCQADVDRGRRPLCRLPRCAESRTPHARSRLSHDTEACFSFPFDPASAWQLLLTVFDKLQHAFCGPAPWKRRAAQQRPDA